MPMQRPPFIVERGGVPLADRGRYGSGDVALPVRRGQTFDGLSYEYASIGAIVSGVFTYTSAKGVVAGAPGVIICGDPEEEFTVTYGASDPLRRILIAFDIELVEEAAIAGGCAPMFPSSAIDRGAQQTRLYGLVARIARSEGDDEVTALDILDLALSAPDYARRSRPVFRAEQIRAAAREITASCTDPWDTAAMADLVGLSRYHFIRAFCDVLGETPHQYLVRARLRLAAKMLLDDSKVTAVALEAGFNDISNFNRTFLRAFGMSPRRWLNGRTSGSTRRISSKDGPRS